MQEKLKISYQVICQQQQQADVAREYRVTAGCVSNVVRRSRKNPKYLAELMERQEVLEDDRE